MSRRLFFYRQAYILLGTRRTCEKHETMICITRWRRTKQHQRCTAQTCSFILYSFNEVVRLIFFSQEEIFSGFRSIAVRQEHQVTTNKWKTSWVLAIVRLKCHVQLNPAITDICNKRSTNFLAHYRISIIANEKK